MESRLIAAAGHISPENHTAIVLFPQRGGLVKVEVGGFFTAIGYVPGRELGAFLARVKDWLEGEGFTTRLRCTLPIQFN